MIEPRVYVSTYGKYNDGNLKGAWLNLEDFSNAEAFYAACRKLHSDEHDPEIMFQDFEGFPSGYYGECFIKDELWDWLKLDDDEKKMLDAYHTGVDQSGTIENARDAYEGTYESPEDWAYQILHDCGDVPEHLEGYVDYKAYARDAGLNFVQTSWDTCFVFYNQ